MAKTPSRRDTLMAELVGIDTECTALHEEVEKLNVLIANARGEQASLLHVIAGGDDVSKVRLREVNELIHSDSMTIDAIEASLAQLAAKRSGIEAEIKEVETLELRAKLRELGKARDAILSDVKAQFGAVGLQLSRLDEIQNQADGLSAQLGQPSDWHKVRRDLSAVASSVLITSRGDRRLTIDYSSGRPRVSSNGQPAEAIEAAAMSA